MSIFSNLFSRKTNKQPKKVAQIGSEIALPAYVIHQIPYYLDKVPDWISPNSGWGYKKENALIMACEDPTEGVQNEYAFAEFRSKIEVREAMEMYFASIERCGQQLIIDESNHHYDVISFKVYLFTEKDWTFLKNDFEIHNNYENDEAGFNKHTRLRNKLIRYYMTECWINIDSFYGKY